MRCGGPRHGCFLGMAKPLRGSLMDRPAPCNSHRGDRKSPRIAPGADTPPWKLPNLHSANFDTGSKLLLAFSRQPVDQVPTQRTQRAREEILMSKIASILVCGVFASILGREHKPFLLRRLRMG